MWCCHLSGSESLRCQQFDFNQSEDHLWEMIIFMVWDGLYLTSAKIEDDQESPVLNSVSPTGTILSSLTYKWITGLKYLKVCYQHSLTLALLSKYSKLCRTFANPSGFCDYIWRYTYCNLTKPCEGVVPVQKCVSIYTHEILSGCQ